jgi:hypothetical protein
MERQRTVSETLRAVPLTGWWRLCIPPPRLTTGPSHEGPHGRKSLAVKLIHLDKEGNTC